MLCIVLFQGLRVVPILSTFWAFEIRYAWFYYKVLPFRIWGRWGCQYRHSLYFFNKKYSPVLVWVWVGCVWISLLLHLWYFLWLLDIPNVLRSCGDKMIKQSPFVHYNIDKPNQTCQILSLLLHIVSRYLWKWLILYCRSNSSLTPLFLSKNSIKAIVRILCLDTNSPRTLSSLAIISADRLTVTFWLPNEYVIRDQSI